MLEWPKSSNLKQLRGFLELIGYYRKFLQGYAHIAHPLTEFLQKNQFCWNDKARVAFEELKLRMTQTLVLKLPNFQEIFCS